MQQLPLPTISRLGLNLSIEPILLGYLCPTNMYLGTSHRSSIHIMESLMTLMVSLFSRLLYFASMRMAGLWVSWNFCWQFKQITPCSTRFSNGQPMNHEPIMHIHQSPWNWLESCNVWSTWLVHNVHIRGFSSYLGSKLLFNAHICAVSFDLHTTAEL